MNGNNNLDFLMGNPGQNNYGNNYNNYQNPMNQNMYGNNGYNNYMNQGYNYDNNYNNDNYNSNSNERDYSNFDVQRIDDNNMDNNYNNGNNYSNNNAYNPINSTDDGNETLFGVPMYEEKKDDKKSEDSNLYLTNQNSFNNNPYQMNSYDGGGYNGLDNMPPIMHNGQMNQANQRENEMLFGVPMYDDNNKGTGDIGEGNRTDIFGQLLTPAGNMRIKGGRIVDDFSKVNIPPQDGILLPNQSMNNGYMDNGMNYNGQMNNQFGMNNYNQPMNNQFGMNNYNQPMGNQFGMNNGYMDNGMNYNQPMNNQFGMNNYNQPMGNQFGMNNGYMDNGMNYNGQMNNQFGMNNYNQPMNNYGMGNQFGMNYNGPMGGMPGYGMPMMPRPPIFNELKVEDNLNQKILSPEEIEAEENPDKKPKPRVDLNLESGSKENNEEFYE